MLKTEDVKMSCKCDTINIVNDNNVIVVSHADGRDGKSAYQQAVEGGYTGTEQEFNCSLSLLADVAEGKQALVTAIEYKGGTSSAEKSFQGIAEDIKEIPNFDQWTRLAGVLAGSSYNKNLLQGHNENVDAGNIVELTDPSGRFTKLNSYTFQYWDLLVNVNLPYVGNITNNYVFRGCTSLKNVVMQNAKIFTGGNIFQECSSLESVIIPNATILTGVYIFGNCINLKNIVVGVLTTLTNVLDSNKLNLRNFTIGQGTDTDLPLYKWIATNVIAEGQSGIDELNTNLYNNLLTKLYDHSTDGQTRTLRLGWLAHVTQENIDYANSKGWTLTT